MAVRASSHYARNNSWIANGGNALVAGAVGYPGVGKRMAKLGVEVDDTYADLAHPTIERQLAKAGTRLAMVLNDIWP